MSHSFHLSVPKPGLRMRLKRTRWPDEILDAIGRSLSLEFLMEICRYWKEDFDWQAQLDRMSVFPHYRFQSTGGKIHFLHAKEKGPAPIPLIMTHGWPGSFLEMLEIIPLSDRSSGTRTLCRNLL